MPVKKSSSRRSVSRKKKHRVKKPKGAGSARAKSVPEAEPQSTGRPVKVRPDNVPAAPTDHSTTKTNDTGAAASTTDVASTTAANAGSARKNKARRKKGGSRKSLPQPVTLLLFGPSESDSETSPAQTNRTETARAARSRRKRGSPVDVSQPRQPKATVTATASAAAAAASGSAPTTTVVSKKATRSRSKRKGRAKVKPQSPPTQPDASYSPPTPAEASRHNDGGGSDRMTRSAAKTKSQLARTRPAEAATSSQSLSAATASNDSVGAVPKKNRRSARKSVAQRTRARASENTTTGASRFSSPKAKSFVVKKRTKSGWKKKTLSKRSPRTSGTAATSPHASQSGAAEEAASSEQVSIGSDHTSETAMPQEQSIAKAKKTKPSAAASGTCGLEEQTAAKESARTPEKYPGLRKRIPRVAKSNAVATMTASHQKRASPSSAQASQTTNTTPARKRPRRSSQKVNKDQTAPKTTVGGASSPSYPRSNSVAVVDQDGFVSYRRVVFGTPGAAKRVTRTWDQQFDRLIDFFEKNGNPNVPADYPADPSLGHWVQKQRQALRAYDARKEGKRGVAGARRITDLQKAKLEGLGFSSDFAMMKNRFM
eukprot:INCI5639.2.p1 GENE.INCI5639.2~~INCI5639.2.p1  ORF type:complete len:599 (-),score=84.97 INCI5639.2:69-1865(-)